MKVKVIVTYYTYFIITLHNYITLNNPPGSLSKMNSDNFLFFEMCQFFEQLSQITNSATEKRTNLSSETGSSIYLTKEAKRQVHQIISQWFSKFKTGSLLSIFRLLVPEVYLYLYFHFHIYIFIFVFIIIFILNL